MKRTHGLSVDFTLLIKEKKGEERKEKKMNSLYFQFCPVFAYTQNNIIFLSQIRSINSCSFTSLSEPHPSFPSFSVSVLSQTVHLSLSSPRSHLWLQQSGVTLIQFPRLLLLPALIPH